MNKNNCFKKNTLLLSIGTFLNKSLQFLVIPIFSRWLSTAEYGRFDLLCTYVSLLIPTITLSTYEAVFRFSVDEQNRNKVISNTTNGFIIHILNFSFFILVSLIFLDKLDKRLYISFAIYLFAELFATYLRCYLRSIKRLDIYSFSMVFNIICIAVFVTIFVFYLRWGIFGILLGYGLGMLLCDATICLLSQWIHMLNFKFFSIHNMKLMFRYSLPLIPNNISWWIMNASDRQIINWFFGDTANGIYAIAHKLPAFCSAVFNTFSVSWQQEIIEKIYLPDRDKYVNDILEKFLTMLLSVCSGLLAGSFILYYFIFDLKYFEAAKYSPILITAAMFMSVSQFVGAIQIALKRPKQNGMATVAGAVSNVFFHLLLVDVIGLYAASISTLISNVLIALLRIIFIKDVCKIRVKKKIAVSVCGGAYFFVMSYFHTYMILNIMNLMLAVVFFVVTNRNMLYEFIKTNEM